MSLAQFVKNQSGFANLSISYQRGETLLAWAMISPWVAGFLLLTAFPMVASLALSFFKWNILSPPEWVGLANYHKLFFSDPLPMHSLKITVIFSLASIPLNIVFGLVIAMLLNTNIRGLAVSARSITCRRSCRGWRWPSSGSGSSPAILACSTRPCASLASRDRLGWAARFGCCQPLSSCGFGASAAA